MSSILGSHTGEVNLLDWNIDRTGGSNVAAAVQAWQDEAGANDLTAVAPFGAFRLDTKVTFKASTRGSGVGIGAHQLNPIGAIPPYTMFFNGAINDNSWMIDFDTSGGNSTFTFIRDFRLHANALNCSLLRILGTESVPAGMAMEKFLWDNIVAYGGWVNLELFGYGGSLRRIYSRGARLSALRTYIANALVIEGGWLGATTSSSWMLEMFGRQTTYETAAGVTINQTVFQNDDGNDAGNGIRISENVQNIKINAYFENICGTGAGSMFLSAGNNKSSHPSPLIPTAVDEANGDAPTNDVRFAVKSLSIDATANHGAASWDYTKLGPRYSFGNVLGLEWGKGTTLTGTRIEYSKNTLDVGELPINPNLSPPNAYMGNFARIQTQANGGATTLTVDDSFLVTATSVLGYVMLESSSWGTKQVHECTITYVDATHLSISPAIPAGRVVPVNYAVSSSKFEMVNPTLRVSDPLNRHKGLPLNLIPPNNFEGSAVNKALRGVREALSQTTGVRYGYDATVSRNGIDGSLKVTRLGVSDPGALVKRFWMYPYGSNTVNLVGVPIVFSGWIRLSDTPGYNSLDQSGSSTQDQPWLGICWRDNNGEHHTTLSMVMLNGQNATRYAEWAPFFFWFTLNDPSTYDLGISVLPSNGGYNATTDFSIWLADMCLAVNPSSWADVRAGRWTHSHHAGQRIGSRLELPVTALPNSANIYVVKGDRFINTSGNIGEPKAWIVTATGAATTATFTSEGNL